MLHKGCLVRKGKSLVGIEIAANIGSLGEPLRGLLTWCGLWLAPYVVGIQVHGSSH